MIGVELDRFKTEIKIEDYAATLGYFRDADDRDPGDAKVSLKHWSAAVSKFESDSGNRSRIRNELEALKLIKISDAYVELA